MMNDHVELTGLIDNPPARRLWLLYNAVQYLPFDQAIERARCAEAFVTGSPGEQRTGDARVDAQPPVAAVLERTDQIVDEGSGSPSVEHPTAIKKRTRLTLPAEQRDQLIKRLVEGARNAELATEFGLSSRQIQGIRMGSARQVAKLREQHRGNPLRAAETPLLTASVDEIVRYLRQQNDIVVAEENGFLVNGRFHLPLADLVARANRMRSRQGKSVFD